MRWLRKTTHRTSNFERKGRTARRTPTELDPFTCTPVVTSTNLKMKPDEQGSLLAAKQTGVQEGQSLRNGCNNL
jgi:hypothetical protein